MNATIDIKTPAGKSLEYYPMVVLQPVDHIAGVFFHAYVQLPIEQNHELHPGDVITITILP